MGSVSSSQDSKGNQNYIYIIKFDVLTQKET